MKLKVCGMKYNTQEVAEIQPDYLGFIFWEPSKRFFEGKMPPLPMGTKKIGVFVDSEIDGILGKIEKYNLWGVQLHGNESPEFCGQIKTKWETASFDPDQDRPSRCPAVIKVFSIKEDFNFEVVKAYEKVCDYFLFDTKGRLPGGNGYAFDWKLLKDYSATIPYFLSGGIGLEEIDAIKEFLGRPESKFCHAIDVNSRFEIEAGLKNIEHLKEFKELLITDY